MTLPPLVGAWKWWLCGVFGWSWVCDWCCAGALGWLSDCCEIDRATPPAARASTAAAAVTNEAGRWVIDVVLMMASKKWLVIRRSRLLRLSGIRRSAMDDARTRYRVCPARPDGRSLVGPTEQR